MTRGMVVVAAGTGSRFAGDKMMATVGGEPLVSLTVARLLPLVDELILVCRPEQRGVLTHLGVTLVDGGLTRTASEIAGLSAVRGDHTLIGVHDGARPNVLPELVERLFSAAASAGGAIPVVGPEGLLVRLTDLTPMTDVMSAQTPQVFRAKELLDAYRLAAAAGFEGHDTADVVQRHTALTIAAVDGDPQNVKVTYPEDLVRVIRE